MEDAPETPAEPAEIRQAKPPRRRRKKEIFDQLVAAGQAEAEAKLHEAAKEFFLADMPHQQQERAKLAEQSNGHSPQGAEFPPDPFEERTVSLTGSNDGPKMRLLRRQPSGRYPGEVAIQFDEPPPQPVREEVYAAGFRRREKEGAWVHLIEEGAEHRTLIAAERLFDKIANELRRGNGLDPVSLEL